MQERHEIKVPTDKVEAAIEQGKSKGWKLISQQWQGKETVIVFERETEENFFEASIAPSYAFVTDQSKPPRKPLYLRPLLWLPIGLLACCCGLCIVAYAIAPSSEEIRQTQTVEAVAQASQQVIDDMTATIVALTPSNTPRPTNTKAPTQTPVPLGEDEVLGLITAAMQVSDLPINGIEMQESDLAVSTDQMRGGYDNELDYRATFIGALVGSVVEIYEGENILARPPRRIQIYFTEGTLIAVKVTLNYSDAKAFLNGGITFNQFFDRWIVE